MIRPTVGRKVWIRKHPKYPYAEQPIDATIVFVHNDRSINVVCFSPNGEMSFLERCPLRQPGDDVPPNVHAEWMPYQISSSVDSGAKVAKPAPSVR